MTPMKTYSNSKLSAYETCPLKYRFQYLDRIRTGAPTASTLVHDYKTSASLPDIRRLERDRQPISTLAREGLK